MVCSSPEINSILFTFSKQNWSDVVPSNNEIEKKQFNNSNTQRQKVSHYSLYCQCCGRNVGQKSIDLIKFFKVL